MRSDARCLETGWLLVFVLASAACAPSEAEIRSDEPLEEDDAFVMVKTEKHVVVSLFSSKALSFEDGVSEDGRVARQAPLGPSGGQVFDLRRTGPGMVALVSIQSGKCLDLLGFNGADGARVGQWACNGKKNQAWRLVRRAGAFELRSAWNGKCLDVLGYRKEDDAELGVWKCKGVPNQLWAVEPYDGLGAASRPGQFLGTQTFAPLYHFEGGDPILESAEAIARMGASMIKLAVSETPAFEKILEMPFSHYFLWYRSASPYYDGLSDAERQKEYDATYAFTKKLLERFSGSGKTFFLGHWEGDWYLLRNFDASGDPPPVAIAGMVEWLNVRQRAIDDAKRRTKYQGVSVYQYTEVNRVLDALRGGKRRLVNAVLPATNVDYVSYSSYDLQGESLATVHATLDYVRSMLPSKAGIRGERVFIGEFGVSAAAVGFDGVEHERRNREIFAKYLSWGAPYVLYWQMFNNEQRNGQQLGYWLINDRNEKQPLYDTLRSFYSEMRAYAAGFERDNGRPLLEGEARAHGVAWLNAR